MINIKLYLIHMKPFFTKVTTNYDPSINIRYFEDRDLDPQWHFHNEYELVYIHKSKGTRYVGDSILPYNEGDLVLLGSNLPHTWINDRLEDPTAISSTTVIHLQENFVKNDFFDLPLMKKVKTLINNSKQGILFTEIKNIEQSLATIRSAENAHKVALVIQLLHELSISENSTMLSTKNYVISADEHDERLGEILNYIIQNFKKKIVLNDLAEKAHMTPQAFCNYFKNKTRKTVFTYINDLRIGFSCRLLIEENLTIELVALYSGYNSTTFFNRKFKEKIGMTPKNYRHKFRFS